LYIHIYITDLQARKRGEQISNLLSCSTVKIPLSPQSPNFILNGTTHRSVLQCVAVCCSVLQCVAVCCSVLQCVAVRCIPNSILNGTTHSSVLQCVAVCYSALHPQFYFTVTIKPQLHPQWYLLPIAVCCSVMQCVAVCCYP